MSNDKTKQYGTTVMVHVHTCKHTCICAHIFSPGNLKYTMNNTIKILFPPIFQMGVVCECACMHVCVCVHACEHMCVCVLFCCFFFSFFLGGGGLDRDTFGAQHYLYQTTSSIITTSAYGKNAGKNDDRSS